MRCSSTHFHKKTQSAFVFLNLKALGLLMNRPLKLIVSGYVNVKDFPLILFLPLRQAPSQDWAFEISARKRVHFSILKNISLRGSAQERPHIFMRAQMFLITG